MFQSKLGFSKPCVTTYLVRKTIKQISKLKKFILIEYCKSLIKKNLINVEK